MTAKELFEALHGVPDEALCGTIKYLVTFDMRTRKGDAFWCRSDTEERVSDDHAAALQRDALTEWLLRRDAGFAMPMYDGGKWWLGDGPHPTRLHALAAACRYVAGQKGAEK